MSKEEPIYFSGLNGLRFFAAVAVMVTHIELIKGQMPFNYLYESSKLVFELGGLGVVFFFVLSGFLITYLLLSEKRKTGTINVKFFYIRRILRIWPLYFFVVILGFFVLPKFHFMDVPYFFLPEFAGQFSILNFLLFVFMLPNLAFAVFRPLPHIGQTWSIGVEEQFYLIWPWVVKKSGNILKTLLSIIVFMVAFKVIISLIYKLDPNNQDLKALKDVVAMFKIESMAIGGIGAWMVFEKKYFNKFLSNYWLLGSFCGVAFLIYFTPEIIQDGIFIVYSVLFLIIILNVSLNQNSFLKLENKIFVFLGNISYGMYMYHMMVVAAVIGFLKYIEFPVSNSLLSQFIVYSGSILFTILISSLSYTLFEARFLKLKNKFTLISSGKK